MEAEVQADFQVASKLRHKSGVVQNTGLFAHKTLKSRFIKMPIPHVHRVDRTSKWLVIYDKERARLQLRATASSARTRHIAVTGITGPVRTIRWLHSSDGLVVATKDKVYVARFSPNEPPKGVAFVEVPLPQRGQSIVRDVRTMAGGLMVDKVRTLQFVPISRGTVGKAVVLVAEAKRQFVSAASVAAGGRIIAAVWHNKKYTLRLFDVRKQRRTLVWKRPCAKGDCSITNWTPHTRRIAYVQAGTFGKQNAQLVLWPQRTAGTPRKISLKPNAHQIKILWATRDESAYLVGDNRRLWMFSAAGKQLWSWTAPGKRQLNAAYIQADGSIIAAAGLVVYAIRNGKHRRLFTAKGAFAERRHGKLVAFAPAKKTAYSFVDQPVKLRDGSIAFSVVNVSETPKPLIISPPK